LSVGFSDVVMDTDEQFSQSGVRRKSDENMFRREEETGN
jgi:hypothetical protein